MAPPTPSEPPPGVRDYLDWLRVECGVAANTLEAYRADLSLYTASLPGGEPARATPDDVLDFLLSEQQRGMSGATQARRLVAVRTLHRWLHAEGRADGDPAAQIDTPRLWDRMPGYLSPADVDRLLAPVPEVAARRPLQLRDQALVELLYACGLRASEAAGLTVEGVVFDEDVVRVRGKGGKDRIVPFGARARDATRRWLDEGRPRLARPRARPTRALLLSVRGRALRREDVWRIVRARAVAAGITKKLSPHTLRHSFATHLLNGGADLRVVQTLLGHASVSTTQIYTRVEEDRMRAAHTRFHPRA